MKQPLSGFEGYVSLIRNVVILVQNKPVLFWNIRLALHRLDRKLYPRRGCPVLDFSSGSSFTIRTRSSLPLSAVITTENALEYKTLVLEASHIRSTIFIYLSTGTLHHARPRRSWKVHFPASRTGQLSGDFHGLIFQIPFQPITCSIHIYPFNLVSIDVANVDLARECVDKIQLCQAGVRNARVCWLVIN